MRTACVLIGLASLLALSACGPSPNNSADESMGPSRPESLDLAIPPALQDLLEAPESATLLTLVSPTEMERPYKEELKDLDPAQLQQVGEWYVLGQAELDVDETSELVESFKTAYFAGEQNGALCFQPHHALKLTKGSRTLEILICFKCRNYRVLPGGGYNNVVMKTDGGMEDAWRSIVRKHKLRDVSAGGD